jgi:peptidoglycan/LPS O-acetylase OafA/YrhL
MIKGLNSFRFFAFLAVFLSHATGIFKMGYLGVLAFFVLSGFLITPILVNMKERRTLSYFTKFYGRRVVRIFPLYYFYLAVVIILLMFNQSNDPKVTGFYSQLRFAVLYVYDFFHASNSFRINPFLTHFWSLAVEEQFYLIWPLVIYFTPFKRLKRVLIITIILSVISRILFLSFITRQQIPFLNTNPIFVVYALPTSHFEAFALGGLFALFVKAQKLVLTFLLMAAFLIIGMITFKWTNGFYDFTSMGYPPFMTGSYKAVWGYSLAYLIFAGVLVNIRQGIFFPRIFNNKVLEYLGKISYGLYIYHFAILYYVHKLILPKSIYTPLSLMLTILVSILSYEFFEKKILLFKEKYFPLNQLKQAPLSVA